MPIEIKDIDNGRGNLITGYGIVTRQEYIDALTKHLKQDKVKLSKYKYSLNDYTAVTRTDVKDDDVVLISSYCNLVASYDSDTIVAIVCDQEHMSALARLTKTLIENSNWEVMNFKTRDEAVAWLKKRAKDKYEINDIAFLST